MLCWRPNENGFTNTKMSVRHRRRRRSLANQSWVEIGGCEPRHDRRLVFANIVLAVLPGGGKAEHGAKFQLKLPSFQRSTSGANAVSPRASSWSAAATLKDGMWNVLIPRGPIRVTPESVAPTSTFICTTLGATAENAIGTVPICNNGSGQVLRAIGPHSGRKATRFRAG